MKRRISDLVKVELSFRTEKLFCKSENGHENFTEQLVENVTHTTVPKLILDAD